WDEIVDAELSLAADGTILELKAEAMADVGAYSVHPWTLVIEPVQVVSFMPGPYRIANYWARARGIATCKAPTGPYRGVGRPISTFVMEGLMDREARSVSLQDRHRDRLGSRAVRRIDDACMRAPRLQSTARRTAARPRRGTL